MSSRTRVLATAAMMALTLGVGAQAAAAWDPPAPRAGAYAGKPVPGYATRPDGPSVMCAIGGITDIERLSLARPQSFSRFHGPRSLIYWYFIRQPLSAPSTIYTQRARSPLSELLSPVKRLP